LWVFSEDRKNFLWIGEDLTRKEKGNVYEIQEVRRERTTLRVPIYIYKKSGELAHPIFSAKNRRTKRVGGYHTIH